MQKLQRFQKLVNIVSIRVGLFSQYVSATSVERPSTCVRRRLVENEDDTPGWSRCLDSGHIPT